MSGIMDGPSARQPNPIVTRFLVVSHEHCVKRVEARPRVVKADRTTARTVTFWCDDYNESMTVPGDRFAEEWDWFDGWMKSHGWPGDIDDGV